MTWPPALKVLLYCRGKLHGCMVGTTDAAVVPPRRVPAQHRLAVPLPCARICASADHLRAAAAF